MINKISNIYNFDGTTALMCIDSLRGNQRAEYNNMKQIVVKLQEKQYIGKITNEEIPNINHNIFNVLDNNITNRFLKNTDIGMKL